MSKMVSTSFSIGLPPIEAYKLEKNKEGVRLSGEHVEGEARILDFGVWLPRASECYRISPDIKDYVIVPVPCIITSIPNTNGDSVNLKELTRFQPEYGQMSYKTWVGKPTFVEHQNQDITKAKGVILDTFLRPIPRMPKFAKLVKLLAYDRTKDPMLVNRLLKREVSTYSTGMYYSSYTCSVCNHRAGKGIAPPCQHTRPMKPTYQLPDGRLAFRQCESIIGFETSVVMDPAYALAQSNLITDLSKV